MEIDKRDAKGGFFQLFDWNSKSRKKLFSSKSELPATGAESSSLGKENSYNSAIARHQQALEVGNRSNDYHYASSASDDSEYGTKAPGVVARLMGLDSLPKPTVNEPSITPFIDSHSFRDSNYTRAAAPFQSEHDIVIFESVRNKLDGFTRNPLDLRLQKVQNRPVERFQSEVLPPKSAKPISVTHNRHLSPIKSPGFVPPKNAAYIIEAANKIMEHSPRAYKNGKMPSIGASSMPFRVRNLKEKMEAAQKLNGPSSVKSVKKQNSGTVQCQSQGGYMYKGSEESKRVSSQISKSKEKPLSHMSQAKSNVQKRDGSSSGRYRISDKQKVHGKTKPSSDGRNVINSQKKKENLSSSRRASEVLRPNQQKQNSAFGKDRENSDASISRVRDKNEPNVSNNHVYERANRIVNKIIVDNEVTPRKTSITTTESRKNLVSSKTKSISVKKPPVNGNNQSDGARKAEGNKSKEYVTSNTAFNGQYKWDTAGKKDGTDIVSFTFTSPIKKSGTRSSYLGTGLSYPSHDPCASEGDLSSSAASSSGFNVIGGDSLSELLEQKLKELTSRVELFQQDVSEADSFSSSSYSHGNMGPTVNLVNSVPMDVRTCKGKLEMRNASDLTSNGKHWLTTEIENKGRGYMEKQCDSGSVEHQGRYNNLVGSGSVSSLPTFSGASSYSCDVDGNSSDESSQQFLSRESYQAMSGSSVKKPHMAEYDTEISDTASSLSVTTISEGITSNLYPALSNNSSYWELQYISDILNSGSLLLEEFALGQTQQIIAPELFDQLENHKSGSNKDTEEPLLLECKVLFDGVGECLEARSGRALTSSWAVWAKQSSMLRKKQWLAEEIYREMLGWMNEEELMVDELVEKDMSCKKGKWVDFEAEMFEEGVKIGKRILTSLVDEVIDDFLF